MKLPQRDANHVTETDSIRILSLCLPATWLVREVTERDYGVDLYIEIVEGSGVSGRLAALQVKGVGNVKFSSDGVASFSDVKVATYNYWMGLPVPVFLIIVDVSTRKAYWTNVKDEARAMQKSVESQGTMSFHVSADHMLDASQDRASLLKLMVSYERERRWPAIQAAVGESLRLFNSLGPLVLYCRRQPADDHASVLVQFLINRHYENYCLLARYVLGTNAPPALREWYDRHMTAVQAGTARPEATFSFALMREFIDSFLRQYFDALSRVYRWVSVEQKYYWSTELPYVLLTLLDRPLNFNADDWWPRYYFDEYEGETFDLAKCLLQDPVPI